MPGTTWRPARVLLPVAGLLTLLFGVTSATAPAVAATSAYLEADAESGTVIPPFSTATNASVSSAAAKRGSNGYVVNSTNAAGFASWSSAAVEQRHTDFSVRTWVQVRSRAAGQSVDLVSVQNVRTVNNFDFFLTADSSRFKWDLQNANSRSSSFTVIPNRWYFLEAYGSYGGSTYTASVRIDGVDQGVIASPGQTASTVKSLWLGTTAAKTHEQWYDDVALRVADSSIGFLGAPVEGHRSSRSHHRLRRQGDLRVDGHGGPERIGDHVRLRVGHHSGVRQPDTGRFGRFERHGSGRVRCCLRAAVRLGRALPPGRH